MCSPFVVIFKSFVDVSSLFFVNIVIKLEFRSKDSVLTFSRQTLEKILLVSVSLYYIIYINLFSFVIKMKKIIENMMYSG